MTYQHTATYSVEDNKLRIYPACRLSTEEYETLKAVGYRWAPKQELFVAPAWSPEREDVAIELCGDIDAEETTLAERAEAKADRLEAAATKAARKANMYYETAKAISDRFHAGQPILLGHHSQRKAERDHAKADRAMDNACKQQERVKHLSWRLRGSLAHAEYKNRDKVRAGRIESLLADLRKLQGSINQGYKLLHTLVMLEQKHAEGRVDMQTQGGHVRNTLALASGGWTIYSMLEGMTTFEEIITFSTEYANSMINNQKAMRWIVHTLNRLEYERDMLGETTRYDGKLTNAILRTFVRTNGGEGLEEDKTRPLLVKSDVPLPLHLTGGQVTRELEHTEDEWRDLMQASGYEVPIRLTDSKPKQAPIVNVDVPSFFAKIYGDEREYKVVHMTKEQYAKIHADYRYIAKSKCGKYRFRVAIDHTNRTSYGGTLCAVFLTDQKVVEIPE